MAAVVPVFAILPLMLFMAVYDLYAVRHGSIRKTANYQDSLNFMGVQEVETWGLGFGDLVFFSLLASSSLAYTMIYISRHAFYDTSRLVGVLMPWVVFTLVTTAILISLRKPLRREQSLGPGLPIPIFAGCGVFGLCMIMYTSVATRQLSRLGLVRTHLLTFPEDRQEISMILPDLNNGCHLLKEGTTGEAGDLRDR